MKKKSILVILFVFLSLFFLRPSLYSTKEHGPINTLNIELPTDVVKLDLDIFRSLSQYIIQGPLHKSLFTLNSTGNIYSELLSSWKISDEGKKYIFEVKDETYFSSGSELTCKVIKENIDHWIKTRSKLIFIKNINSVMCELNSLKIELKRPTFLMLHELSKAKYAIINDPIKRDVKDGLGEYELESFNKYNLPILRLKKDDERPFLAKKVEFFPPGVIVSPHLSLVTRDSAIVKSAQVVNSNFYERIYLLSPGRSTQKGVLPCISSLIKRRKLFPENKQDLYYPAFGVTQPGAIGYVDEFDFKKNTSHLDCKKFKFSRPIKIVATKVSELQRREFQSAFAKIGADIEIVELGIKKFVRVLKTGESDIYFFSFGSSGNSIDTVLTFYQKGYDNFPSHNYLKEKLEDIQDLFFIKSKLELNSRLKKIQNDAHMLGALVPLFMKKTTHLIHQCLRYKKSKNKLSSHVDLQSIIRSHGCEI